MKLHSTLQLLAIFQPEELKRLRERHPGAAPYLQAEGQVLGPNSLETAAWDVTRAMLISIQPVAKRAIVETGHKLRLARRLELIGTIVSATSSGAVVGVTVGLQSLLGGALFGALSLASVILPQTVNWLRQANIGTETAATHFVKLRECIWDAEFLMKKLDAISPESPQAQDLVERAETLARTMVVALGGLGYEVVA